MIEAPLPAAIAPTLYAEWRDIPLPAISGCSILLSLLTKFLPSGPSLIDLDYLSGHTYHRLGFERSCLPVLKRMPSHTGKCSGDYSSPQIDREDVLSDGSLPTGKRPNPTDIYVGSQSANAPENARTEPGEARRQARHHLPADPEIREGHESRRREPAAGHGQGTRSADRPTSSPTPLLPRQGPACRRKAPRS